MHTSEQLLMWHKFVCLQTVPVPAPGNSSNAATTAPVATAPLSPTPPAITPTEPVPESPPTPENVRINLIS